MFLTETYAIEDYIRINALTSNDGIWSNSTATVSYSSNGMYISNGNWSPFYLLDVLSQGTSIEFDILSVNNTAGYCLITTISSDTSESSGYGQTQLNSTGHYKFKIENNIVTLYKDNTVIETNNWSYSSSYWFLWTGGTRGVTLKNLKVKAL